MIASLAQDIDNRRQLRRAGAPVRGKACDRLSALEERVAKLEAQMKAPPLGPSVAIGAATRRSPAWLARIREAVCGFWNIHPNLLVQRNSEAVSNAKFAGCWLAVELTAFKTREIAPTFGLNCHSSVAHNVRRMREVMSLEPKMAANMNALRDQLKKEFGL
jgi:hypothetical protein